VSPIDPDEEEQIPPEAASTYTKLAAAYGQSYYQSVTETVAPHLQPGELLLDAGTGPGFLPLLLAERAPGVEIYAFDFTRALVEYGREEAISRGVGDRVSFFVADCYSIPVRDRGVAAVTCTGVLHSLDDPVAALRELYRVLEVGGTAWVFDPAILDLPDEIDIELTDHEREVFEAYGVRAASDQPPLSVSEAEQLVDDSPFVAVDVATGESGDVRLRLTRRE